MSFPSTDIVLQHPTSQYHLSKLFKSPNKYSSSAYTPWLHVVIDHSDYKCMVIEVILWILNQRHLLKKKKELKELRGICFALGSEPLLQRLGVLVLLDLHLHVSTCKCTFLHLHVQIYIYIKPKDLFTEKHARWSLTMHTKMGEKQTKEKNKTRYHANKMTSTSRCVLVVPEPYLYANPSTGPQCPWWLTQSLPLRASSKQLLGPRTAKFT